MSTSTPIPIYVLHANTPQEESHLHNQLHADVEGPIAQKPTTSTAIQTARDAIAHAAGLDTEQWCTQYVIVIDRPATDVLDYGVLVVNMDFRGRVDGLRMPPSQAASNIWSMFNGTTDWEEYIMSARSPYLHNLRQPIFLVYLDRDILAASAAEITKYVRARLDAGYDARKKNLGTCCRLLCDTDGEDGESDNEDGGYEYEDDAKRKVLARNPRDLEEVATHHARVAHATKCHSRLGCFVALEEWSFEEAGVWVCRMPREDGESIEAFLVGVEVAGEVLNSVAIGLSSWEDEMARAVVHSL